MSFLLAGNRRHHCFQRPELMDEVVKERYNPAQWNIYAAQASDGDNWADDSPLCHEILAKKLLPVVRYYSYIEITRRAHQTLWREYEHLNLLSTTLRCSTSATG